MLLLKHLHILPMAGPGPMNGDILLENGKIRALGRELSAPGAQVLELEGLYAMPGMVDAHCHIGMWEDGNMIEGDDGNETSGPITPELRAIDAINPFDRCFAEACAAGVTACVTGPGSANVIGGQFAALKTRPGSVEDKLIQAPLAMKAALGETPSGSMPRKRAAPRPVWPLPPCCGGRCWKPKHMPKSGWRRRGQILTWQKRPCCLCCGGNCP